MWSFVSKEEMKRVGLDEIEPDRFVEKFFVDDVRIEKQDGKWTANNKEIPSEVAKLLIDRGHYLNVKIYNVDGVMYRLYDTGLCLKYGDDKPAPKILTDKFIARYRVKYVVEKVFDTDKGATLWHHYLSTLINGEVVDRIPETIRRRCVNEADPRSYHVYSVYYFISSTGYLYTESGRNLGFAYDYAYEKYIPELTRHPEYNRDIPE